MEQSGLVAQLDQDKYGDLHRMYCLFRRVTGGLDLLRQVRENVVVKRGVGSSRVVVPKCGWLSCFTCWLAGG